MKVFVQAQYKSIPAGLSFDLPNFSILTGKNGSGKSHLLEMMANQQCSTVTSDGVRMTNIFHVGYNGLNPQIEERCDPAQLVQNAANWWGQVNSIAQHYKLHFLGKSEFGNLILDYVIPHHGVNVMRDSILRSVLKNTGKSLDQINEEDVYSNMSFAENGNGTMFFSQCATIFKAYHTRWRKNKFNKFLISEGDSEGVTFLSDVEFSQKYGPPPWELINDILARAKLPYKCNQPNNGDADLAYILRLVDTSTGVDISVNDLSSGEKVLMSLALAIYNTQEGGVRPELLLLDEPDAPLHPEYSRLLVEVVIETIVERAGVKVVMTTHSPATVAMAPDNSIYEVTRDTKTPMMVSNARAVAILTEGIGFLRVSYEKRRQIFVESKYDVIYFEKLFDALCRRRGYSYQPIFMEPHSGSSNCTDVIKIVDRLRLAGSDSVWGIVDYDGVNMTRDNLLVLGENKRYAIENYILDPLYVTFALIRERKFSFGDFGVTSRVTYPEASCLTESECQTLVDNFLVRVGFALEDLVPVVLENEYIINYPKLCLMYQGHEYEKLIKDKFKELNVISKGNGDSALKLGVSEVIAEFPQFLPKEVGDLFSFLDEGRE